LEICSFTCQAFVTSSAQIIGNSFEFLAKILSIISVGVFLQINLLHVDYKLMSIYYIDYLHYHLRKGIPKIIWERIEPLLFTASLNHWQNCPLATQSYSWWFYTNIRKFLCFQKETLCGCLFAIIHRFSATGALQIVMDILLNTLSNLLFNLYLKNTSLILPLFCFNEEPVLHVLSTLFTVVYQET
jgi:hypothetical protein